MNQIPSLLSIADRLARARAELSVAVQNDATTNVISIGGLNQTDDRRRNEKLIRRLVDEGRWDSTAPAFQDVQAWVDAHWHPKRETRPPDGTVPSGAGVQLQVEFRVDLSIAPKSLIVAAGLYGAGIVADYAVGFARHGMIELEATYVLKGRPVHERLRLDDFCALLPYREALKKGVRADDFLGDSSCTPRWTTLPAERVCAIEVRIFRSIDLYGPGIMHFESPLTLYGPDLLALMLGLVWGNGFRFFGIWHRIPEVVAAILPESQNSNHGGSGGGRIELPLAGFGEKPEARPLDVEQLAALANAYTRLPEQSRRILALAMRRLRDSKMRHLRDFSENSNLEDAVIDTSIALEVLLMEDGEYRNQRKIVSRRGSWYYADSVAEREQTRELIKRFYDWRSNIVHGKTVENPSPEEEERCSKLLVDVTNVVRAILKDMICEGIPEDWEASEDCRSVRHDPPRAESDVRSEKSDSLSWSVAEQKEIDRALEAVWKPTVASAPTAPPDASFGMEQGISPELVERYRKDGIPYVILHPARLYMAHPKWPKSASDPLDQRTQYYCERDVERHLQAWQETASAKKIHQFRVGNHAPFYHPRNRIGWPQPLE